MAGPSDRRIQNERRQTNRYVCYLNLDFFTKQLGIILYPHCSPRYVQGYKMKDDWGGSTWKNYKND